MSTLSRYLLLRTGARFCLLLLVFLLVLVGGQLGLAIGRGVPPEACLPVLEGMLLFALPIALPLAMATAILVVIGAMNQDGELRALAASGVSQVAVVIRLGPLVLAGVAVCLVLTHLVLPAAVADLRANKGRLLQTAIAQCVANDEPIFQRQNVSVWVGAVDGHRLYDVHALDWSKDTFTACFAPEARWVMRSNGLEMEFRNVLVLQRKANGRFTTANVATYDYPWVEDTQTIGQTEPDALPTGEVMALAADVPAANDDQSRFNNARLALHFRTFLPLSLIAFSLFAAGLGLLFGTAQNLPGVAVVVVTVALATYPAFGYVKTNVDQVQMSPGFLLWPPAVILGLAGAWMVWWGGDRAREALLAPFAYLAQRWRDRSP